MRLIFDLGHPAHFHLFKYTIKSLKDSGHDVQIIARQKDCLLALLSKTGWSYYVVSRKRKSLLALAWQTFKTFFVAAYLSARKPTDFIIGTSVVAGLVSRITGSVSLVFNEDDADVVPIFAKLAYPFAHYIVTPASLKREDHGRKHIKYSGFHELAYLHPDFFHPDQRILRELGIEKGEKYFLVRLVSLTAHHDIGEKGLSTSQAKEIVDRLSRHGKVFISAERTVDDELERYLLPTSAERILDVLYFAHMVIGDSQTMSLEAGLIGTPALRCNSFFGRLSVPEEVEQRYGLIASFRPDDFDKVLSKIEEWLADDDLKAKWNQKRQFMLSECISLTPWILKLFSDLKEKRI